jgi:hypothetical protein
MSDDDIFDFGFTAVSEDDLEAIQTAESSAAELEQRLEKLYNAILPLLKNLKQNPDKDYIYWPDRVAKVEQFEKHIKKITYP